MTERIGFVGLGNMGVPMAANIAKAGYDVLAYDIRDAARAEAAARGVASASSVREVADWAETVLISLPTPPAVEQVVLGDGGLAQGARMRCLVDLSTSGPQVAKRLAADLEKRGVALIEAPVSGGIGGAEAGRLAIMASGPEAIFQRVEPILALLGKPYFVGVGAGLGQTMKLVNNMVSGAALAVTAEAMALGAKVGIDPAVMIDVLNAGSGRNTATCDKFPKAVLTGTYDYGFATELMFKDATLFMKEADALGLSLDTARAIWRLWSEAYADDERSDFTAIAKFVASRSGVSLKAWSAGAESEVGA